MRRIIAIAAALLGIGYIAAPVAAQTTPTTTVPAGPTTTTATRTTVPGGIFIDGPLTLTPTTAAAGAKVTVGATGVGAGSGPLHLTSSANPSGVLLGTVTVPASGVLNVEVTIPANTTAGTWYMRAVINGKVLASPITVTANGSATPTTTVAGTTPDALPNNGPLATLPMILAAVAVGFGGLVMARRTNRA